MNRGRRFAPTVNGTPLSYADFLDGLRDDAGHRATFNRWLADAPIASYRWEVPVVTAALANRPFEFVLLAAAGFGSRPDPKPFADAFRSAGDAEAVAFPNLGRNAILIAPCPTGPLRPYTDLAAFVRGASEHQRDALWRLVGTEVRSRLNEQPLWLSTAGLGVAWVHVRIDDQPKYYGHAPYVTLPAQIGG